MNIGKHYPAAPIAHDPHLCDEPPPGIAYPPHAVLSRYPNLRAHTCITAETRAKGRLVALEDPDTEPHPYQPSSRSSCEDGIPAARPLCA
ncbi:hypothetical protein AB0F72_15590, partial [Actinoplanes sp. NPDC023936]|uniref:hypothetical protein n=1 Tax=Actinoplanes sp. NPDC023936 TaxID=3154910 RepID=UPI0033C00C1A